MNEQAYTSFFDLLELTKNLGTEKVFEMKRTEINLHKNQFVNTGFSLDKNAIINWAVLPPREKIYDRRIAATSTYIEKSMYLDLSF